MTKLVVLLLLLLMAWPAQAQESALRFDPADVFKLIVQYPDLDYHLYEYVDGQGVCDLSRPDGVRACGLDMAALVEPFRALTVVEYLERLPVNWQTWDWDAGDAQDYVPVALVVDIRLWNPDDNVARRLYLACSFIPDDPAHGACVRSDRLDHINYLLVPADELAAAIAAEPSWYYRKAGLCPTRLWAA